MRSFVPRDQRDALRQRVAPLSTLSITWVVVLPFVPVLSVVLVYTAAYTITMGPDPGFPAQFSNVPLGAGYVVVIAILYWHSSPTTWSATVPVRRPTIRELGTGAFFACLGVGVVIGVNNLAELFDASLHAPGNVETILGFGGLLFASVVAAPVVEEILFRGLLFGHLFSRGLRLWIAAALSILAFGAYHLLITGLSSFIVGISLGALLTGLRIWFDNLVGAWLMHVLVNLWAFMIALSVFPPLW